MNIIEKMLTRKSHKELDLNTHISLKNDYIFFQVSKVASSSIKNFLQGIEVESTGRKVINVNDRYVSPHIWPTQIKNKHFISLLESNDIRKISFVRNPYSRILSCYLHRIIKDINSPSNQALSRYTGGLCGPKISFNDFVKVICEQKSIEQESHWRRQSDEIFFDIIPNWDFIGRFENLTDDILTMKEIIKGGSDKTTFNQDENKSPMATGAGDKLKTYYDDITQERLYESYIDDFINFNYKKEL